MEIKFDLCEWSFHLIFSITLILDYFKITLLSNPLQC